MSFREASFRSFLRHSCCRRHHHQDELTGGCPSTNSTRCFVWLNLVVRHCSSLGCIWFACSQASSRIVRMYLADPAATDATSLYWPRPRRIGRVRALRGPLNVFISIETASVRDSHRGGGVKIAERRSLETTWCCDCQLKISGSPRNLVLDVANVRGSN